MRRFWLAPLVLAACDQPLTIITHVDRIPSFHASQLPVMGGAAFPVEVHGAPLEGITAAEAVGLLKVPQGMAQETRFAIVPPGAGTQFRLVLHFNPSGPPNGYHDCRHTAPATTRPPAAVGFTVNATFCEGEKWLAHGYMRVPEIAPEEREDFTGALRQLLFVMLREEQDQ